jgi:hypothetical protein
MLDVLPQSSVAVYTEVIVVVQAVVSTVVSTCEVKSTSQLSDHLGS